MLLKYIDHDKKAELNTQLVKHNVSWLDYEVLNVTIVN